MKGNLAMRLEENIEKDSQKSRYIKEQNRKLIDKIEWQIDRQIGKVKKKQKNEERDRIWLEKLVNK